MWQACTRTMTRALGIHSQLPPFSGCQLNGLIVYKSVWRERSQDKRCSFHIRLKWLRRLDAEQRKLGKSRLPKRCSQADLFGSCSVHQLLDCHPTHLQYAFQDPSVPHFSHSLRLMRFGIIWLMLYSMHCAMQEIYLVSFHLFAVRFCIRHFLRCTAF